MKSRFQLSDDFSLCRYLTYPHSNGFADRGRSLIFGQFSQNVFSFWEHNLDSGREKCLCRIPQTAVGDKALLWFDVARDANVLVAIMNNSLLRLDLNQSASSKEPEIIYREPSDSDANFEDICSISDDAKKVLMVRRFPDGRNQIVEVDLRQNAATNDIRVLLEVPWHAGHAHYCPHDESWIAFCHEGTTTKIPDRVWAMHPTHAPRAQCLFRNADSGLCIGHERWASHTNSAYAVAYGESPKGPRGIYEIFASSMPSSTPRLVSEGDRDWHVDVSRDGRWAVVDTTGPHDAPGKGWEHADDISDILIVDTITGSRQFLARSRNGGKHPHHPHPVFSPDGAIIFYNEAAPDHQGNRIVAVGNPLAVI